MLGAWPVEPRPGFFSTRDLTTVQGLSIKNPCPSVPGGHRQKKGRGFVGLVAGREMFDGDLGRGTGSLSERELSA